MLVLFPVVVTASIISPFPPAFDRPHGLDEVEKLVRECLGKLRAVLVQG